MSYDVHVRGADYSITSNMKTFLKIFDVYPPDWDGMYSKRVASRIRVSLKRIRKVEPETLSKLFDNAYGWGSVKHTVKWLESVEEHCRLNRNQKVTVDY